MTFQYATPAGSITSPNTNTAINCLAVGAVPFDNYSDGNLTSYSSRGPTNSGNTGIDIVGPTNTTSSICRAFRGHKLFNAKHGRGHSRPLVELAPV